MGTLGIANAWRTRDVAQVVIGEPLTVEDYVQEYGKRPAQGKLTEDLHGSIGEMKAELSGVPYDTQAPKVGEVLKL